MFCNKKIIVSIFICISMTGFAREMQYCQDSIDLTVVDYMLEPATAVFENGPIIPAHKFLIKGMCPVRLIVTNHRDKAINFSSKCISLPTMTVKEVKKQIYEPVSVKYGLSTIGVLALIGFYLCMHHNTVIGCNYKWFHTSMDIRNIRLPFCYYPYWFLGSIMTGMLVHWHKENKVEHEYEMLMQIIMREFLSTHVNIEPGSTVSKLIYIPYKEYAMHSFFMLDVYPVQESEHPITFTIKTRT